MKHAWGLLTLALVLGGAVRPGEGGATNPADSSGQPPRGIGLFNAGAVAALGGEVSLRRPWLDRNGAAKTPEPGDLLHPGDELSIGPNGFLEAIWGVNVRLRLGPGSFAAIRSGWLPPPEGPDSPLAPPGDDGNGVGVAEWRLTNGALHARVRENRLFPATLLLTTRKTAAMLERGDITLRSNDGVDALNVADGTVRVDSRAWRGMLSKGEGLAPTGEVVPWTAGPDDDARNALRFTVDAQRDLLPQPP